MTGSGTSIDPYIIYNVDDLQAIESDLDAYYILNNDIDASVTSGWNGGAGFVPITAFQGQIDGKGYKITDLWLDRWGVAHTQALLKYGFGCTILNLGITGTFKGLNQCAALAGGLYDCEPFHPYDISPFNITNCWCDAYVKGRRTCGGLIGEIYVSSPVDEDNPHMSYITDCYSKGTLEGYNSLSWCDEFGGFFGTDDGTSSGLCTISNCYSEVNVTGLNTFTASGVNGDLGGFVGRLREIIIKDCYATGNVSGTLGGRWSGCGGFVGSYFTWSEALIERCYSTGNVKGYQYVGGFVGYCETGDNPVKNCFARGNTTTEGSGNDKCGGFVGYSSTGEVKHCYSTGTPTGSSNVGGFCGDAIDPSDIIQCFWDEWTSGTAVSDGGVGKHTPYMKTESTFTDVGWDFVDTWDRKDEINDGYPHLRPQFDCGDFYWW